MKMNENVKNILKGIANIAINSGASRFFTNIAMATMPPETKLIAKGCTIVAASLMGSMMGDKTYDYTMKAIENVKNGIHIEITEENKEEEE